ncbi:Transposon protein [Arachis hypogaea]|nr:Transposon protein [Arachis hypogaea]
MVSSIVLFPSFLTRFFFVIYIMDDSTSDCQLNPSEVDYEFESNEFPEPLSVVDDQFVSKVGMTFTILEVAGKVYRNYAKAAGFSTRVRSTNRKGNEIKNQLITCSREGKWKSKISQTAQGTKHVHSSYNRE